MNNYELLVLFGEDTAETAQKKLTDEIKDLVEKNKGDLKNIESWGKKSLAFQIGQNKSGFYWLLFFEAAETLPKKISDLLRIEDSILRFLITRTETKAKVTPKRKKIETKKKVSEPAFIR